MKNETFETPAKTHFVMARSYLGRDTRAGGFHCLERLQIPEPTLAEAVKALTTRATRLPEKPYYFYVTSKPVGYYAKDPRYFVGGIIVHRNDPQFPWPNLPSNSDLVGVIRIPGIDHLIRESHVTQVFRGDIYLETLTSTPVYF